MLKRIVHLCQNRENVKKSDDLKMWISQIQFMPIICILQQKDFGSDSYFIITLYLVACKKLHPYRVLKQTKSVQVRSVGYWRPSLWGPMRIPRAMQGKKNSKCTSGRTFDFISLNEQFYSQSNRKYPRWSMLPHYIESYRNFLNRKNWWVQHFEKCF